MALTPKSSDDLLGNVLSALSEAILTDAEGGELDSIVARYAVSRAEIEPLIEIIRRLHVALVGVRPSRRFAQRLRGELLGTASRGMLMRVRYLPPRVQIAAGVVLIAGFMLLSRRRLRGDGTAEANEVSLAS